MRVFLWLVRFFIPLIVLYVIGYYVSGFSALTIPWLIILSALITIGDWLIFRAIGGRPTGRLAKIMITFLISTVVIFTVTFAIEGGHVSLGGALLAALIISLLHALLPNEQRVNSYSNTR